MNFTILALGLKLPRMFRNCWSSTFTASIMNALLPLWAIKSPTQYKTELDFWIYGIFSCLLSLDSLTQPEGLTCLQSAVPLIGFMYAALLYQQDMMERAPEKGRMHATPKTQTPHPAVSGIAGSAKERRLAFLARGFYGVMREDASCQ